MAQPDHAGGVPLDALLDHVNTLSERLLPDEDGHDSRVSRVFTPRSFRHYQTLGCIDAPERDGKRALYGTRHFVQGLLVRKLLWEGASVEKITELVTGRSTEETKRMLSAGPEQVIRPTSVVAAEDSEAMGQPSVWQRMPVAPGIELHLREGLQKLKPGELKDLLAALETALRRAYRRGL